MKKVLCLLLAVLMLVTLAGCKGPSQGGGSQGGGSQGGGSQGGGSQEAEFARGSWDADMKVFTNESTGIKITLTNDNYVAYDDSELTETYLDDPNYDLSSMNYKTELSIPDCGFKNAFTGANTGVVYENIKAEGAPNISVDDYLDVVTQQLNVTTGSYYDLTLSGQAYRACDIDNQSAGISYHQTMACRKVGGYMTIIVFTSLDETGNQEMMAFFN